MARRISPRRTQQQMVRDDVFSAISNLDKAWQRLESRLGHDRDWIDNQFAITHENVMKLWETLRVMDEQGSL